MVEIIYYKGTQVDNILSVNVVTYVPDRKKGEVRLVSQNPLPLRLDLGNHSPSGFSTGYNGSGPHQLALALLAHAFDDEFAQKYANQVKTRFIAHIQDKEWTFRQQAFRTLVRKILGTAAWGEQEDELIVI